MEKEKIIQTLEYISFIIEPDMFKEDSIPEQIQKEGSLAVASVNIFDEIFTNETTTQEVIQFLQSQSEAVENGEMSPIEAYRRLRGLKEIIETCIGDIESDVKAEITRNPKEYFDFSLSTRRTLQYKQCEAYNQKQEELKAIEEKIKRATEMKEKGDTYIDADGVIIEPVEVKYTEVLTYKPKR